MQLAIRFLWFQCVISTFLVLPQAFPFSLLELSVLFLVRRKLITPLKPHGFYLQLNSGTHITLSERQISPNPGLPWLTWMLQRLCSTCGMPVFAKKKQQKDLLRGRNFVPETQLRVWSCASRSTEEGSVFNVASRALLLQTASATKLKWTYRHCNMCSLCEHIKGLVPTSPAGRPGSSINCCNIEQLLSTLLLRDVKHFQERTMDTSYAWHHKVLCCNFTAITCKRLREYSRDVRSADSISRETWICFEIRDLKFCVTREDRQP